MKRFALGVEYHGTAFSGWQFQPGLRTVQFELEKALSKIADEPIQVICAGRTDAGVHGLGQVIHFDTSVKRPGQAWIMGVNSELSQEISVIFAKEVEDSFHARFSAISRHYSYFIYNAPIRSPMSINRMTWYRHLLNVEAMQEAANFLIGEHDFSSFRAAECQSKSPLRHLMELILTRDRSVVRMDFKANAFLHHMVRNIVGVLLLIGQGKKPAGWMQEVLEAKDRRAADITAPPEGLYFMKVDYPEGFQMPQARQLNIVASLDFPMI